VSSLADQPTTSPPGTLNRISPIRFIVGFGIISELADVVYEGAPRRDAVVVGVITGRRAARRSSTPR
jgi:hypothetical protein